jgi:hypothetical protein
MPAKSTLYYVVYSVRVTDRASPDYGFLVDRSAVFKSLAGVKRFTTSMGRRDDQHVVGRPTIVAGSRY